MVGQGNVALDVARTLLSKVEDLQKTDITEHALQALSQSKIKHVHVVGRRGPMQAAFTIKEVRELLHLDDVNFTPIPDELFPRDLKALPRPRRRLLELLQKGSPSKEGATKSWSLDFLLAPLGLKWTAENSRKLEGVVFSKTKLEAPESSESKVSSTDETITLPTSTLFRSIGYKAEAIPGMEDLGANFDERKGTIQHDGTGRIVPLETVPLSGSGTTKRASLYCSGWVKRGPTGVIASTMTDAFQTAEAIIEDWKKAFHSGDIAKVAQRNLAPERLGWQGVLRDSKTMKMNLNPVHWENWQSIDREEKRLGESRGKPREKFGSVNEMLQVSGK